MKPPQPTQYFAHIIAVMRSALVVLAAVPVVAFAALPLARADEDDNYLAALRAAGVTVDDPEDMIGAGHLICEDLRNGTSPADEPSTWTSYTLRQARAMVAAAQAVYPHCP
jgi:Protein of unknown function (DUF732)